MVRLSWLVGRSAAIAKNLSWFDPPWTPQTSGPWPTLRTGLKKSWLDWQKKGGPKHRLLTHKSSLCRPKTPRSMLTNENWDKNSAAGSSCRFQTPDGASTCAAYITGNRSATLKLSRRSIGWTASRVGRLTAVMCCLARKSSELQTRSHARSWSSASNVLCNLFVLTAKEIFYENREDTI